MPFIQRLKRTIRTVLPRWIYDLLLVRYWILKNRLQRNYERERDMVASFVKTGDHVVDIGVNYGQYAVHLARWVGTTGKVIGFEASQRTFLLARRIIRSKQVELHHLALSDRETTVLLHTPVDSSGLPNTGLASVVPPGTTARDGELSTVRAMTLDAFLAASTHPICFIKCDIEGHEVAAFEGATATILRDTPSILVETERGNMERLQRLLAPAGYTAWIAREDGRLAVLTELPAGRFNCFFLPPDAIGGRRPCAPIAVGEQK